MVKNNTALNGGGLYVNTLVTIDSMQVVANKAGNESNNDNSQFGFGGGIYVNQVVANLLSVQVMDNISYNNSKGNTVLGEKEYNNLSGIYVKNTSNTLTLNISNESKIIDVIYLSDNTLIYVLDRATTEQKANRYDGYTLKLCLETSIIDSDVEVAKYDYSEDVDILKFFANDTVFTQNENVVLATHSTVENVLVENEFFATLRDAVLNATSVNGKVVLKITQDQVISDITKVVVPYGVDVTLVCESGVKIYRQQESNVYYTGYLFEVFGEINFNLSSDDNYSGVTNNEFIIDGGKFVDGEFTGEYIDNCNSLIYIADQTGKVVLNSQVILRNNKASNASHIQVENPTNNILVEDVFDASYGGAVYVNGGNLTIDGAQIIRNSAVNGGAIYVGDGSVNFISGIIGGSYENKNSAVDGGAIYVFAGGLIIGDGIIDESQIEISYNEASSNGGAIYIGSYGVSSVTNAKIISNSANNGGAVYVNVTGVIINEEFGTEINFVNTLFESNSAVDGGAVYVCSGLFKTSKDAAAEKGTIFNLNNASNDGGAIYVDKQGFIKLEDSEFTSNIATNNGGSICYNGMNDGSSLTVSTLDDKFGTTDSSSYLENLRTDEKVSSIFSSSIDGVSSQNSASNGGGIYIGSGSLHIYNSLIQNVKATNFGGGISSVNDSNIIIYSSSIVNNSAAFGAGLYLSNSYTKLFGSIVTDNVASQNGGGLYFISGSLEIDKITLREFSEDEIKYSNVLNNVSSNNGAGLYLGKEAGAKNFDVSISNTIISNNNLLAGFGSGLYIDGAKVELEGNVTISSNTLENLTGNQNEYGLGITLNSGWLTLYGTNTIDNQRKDGENSLILINAPTIQKEVGSEVINSYDNLFRIAGNVDKISDGIKLNNRDAWIYIQDQSMDGRVFESTNQNSIIIELAENALENDKVIGFIASSSEELISNTFGVSLETGKILGYVGYTNSNWLVVRTQLYQIFSKDGTILQASESLEQAIEQASNGSLILINDNSTLTLNLENTLIIDGKELTISSKISNFYIQRAEEFYGNMFNINQGASLFVGFNSEFEAVYKAQIGDNYKYNIINFVGSQNSSTHIFYNKGTLTLAEGVKVYGENSSSNGAVIYAEQNSTAVDKLVVNIFGAEIYNNTASNGGAFYITNGTFNMDGGKIYNNSAIRNGGAMSIYSSKIEILSGSIYNNKTDSGDGGALYIDSCSTSTNKIYADFGVSNNDKYSNVAYKNGGAIYLNNSNVTVKYSNFVNNKAQYGGAIYSINSILNIGSQTEQSSVRFDRNFANYGGAITFYRSPSEETMFYNSVTFINNSANYYGGALYIYTDILTNGGNSSSSSSSQINLSIINSSFNSNMAKPTSSSSPLKSNGGAIYSSKANLELQSTLFTSNTAKDYGGAIYTILSNIRVSGTSSFISNNAENGSGGAIYIDEDNSNTSVHPKIIIDGTNIQFSSNYAKVNGGAISMLELSKNSQGNYSLNGKLLSTEIFLATATIENNTADGLGNGIYVIGSNFNLGTSASGNILQDYTLSQDLKIRDDVYLTSYVETSSNDVKYSIIGIRGKYNKNITDKVNIISPLKFNNYGFVVATYDGAIDYNYLSPDLFIGQDSEGNDYCFIIQELNVIIGEKNVYNATTNRYYQAIEDALNENALSLEENIIVLLKDMEITSSVSISSNREGSESVGRYSIVLYSGAIVETDIRDDKGDIIIYAGEPAYGEYYDGQLWNLIFSSSGEIVLEKTNFEIYNINIKLNNPTTSDAVIKIINSSTLYMDNIDVNVYENEQGLASSFNANFVKIDSSNAKLTNMTFDSVDLGSKYAINVVNSNDCPAGDFSTYSVVLENIIFNNCKTIDTLIKVESSTVGIINPTITNTNKDEDNVGTSSPIKVIDTITAQTSNVTILFNNETSKIDGNYASQGGALYVTSTSKSSENILLIPNVTLKVENSSNLDRIINNTASMGGGIYVDAGNLTLENINVKGNSVIYKNNGEGLGGGIFIGVNGIATLNQVVIDSNKAYSLENGVEKYSQNTFGGGIYCMGGLTTLNNTVISNNVSNSGAGIHFNYTRDNSFTNLSGVVILQNLNIKYNNAYANGGGIYFYYQENISTTLDLYSTLNIEYNTAGYNEELGGNGGGLFVGGYGKIKFVDNQQNDNQLNIRYNSAKEKSNQIGLGGGIFLAENASIEYIDNFVGANITSNSAYLGGGIYLSGVVTIQKLNINGNSATSGGGIYVLKGTLSLSGATISSNSSTNGGGIYIANGTVDVNTTSISSNTTTDGNGGGIYLKKGTLSLSGATISENSVTSGNGGGIYIAGGTTSVTNTSSISNNSAINGGGIYFDNPQKVTLQDVKISSNNAQNGAGIYINDFETSFKFNSGVSIVSNTATNNGGGIYSAYSKEGVSNLNIGVETISANTEGQESSSTSNQNNKVIIEVNKANNGGGIYVINGNNIVISANIVSNTATNNGGGIYIESGNKVEINASKIGYKETSATQTVSKGNEAINGGGIYVNKAKVNITSSSEIAYNSATNDGGGLFVAGGTIKVNEVSISNNSSTNGNGGGIYVSGGTINITNESSISNNNSSTDGGGIYVSGGELNLDKATVSSNNTTSGNGGGLYVAGGVVEIKNMSTLSSNSSTSGGGIYVSGGELNLDNATVSSNSTTSGNGGGLFVANGTVEIANVSVISNNLSTNGGGIYVQGGTIDIYGNSQIVSNSANSGGGLYVVGGTTSLQEVVVGNATINDSKTEYQSNSATNGGGIYFNGGKLNFTDKTKLQYNTATSGGGLFINSYDGSDEITLNAATSISNNEATSGGGIYVNASSSTLTITGKIFNNGQLAKTSNGGGIFINSGNVKVNSANIYSNIAQNNGGGIYNKGTLSLVSSYIGINDTDNQTNLGNIANNNGGGIYNQGSININSTSYVQYNKAMSSSLNSSGGGGIYSTNGTIALYGHIQYNTAYNGSGIYLGGGTLNTLVTQNGNSSISSSISNNFAENFGALYIANGTANIGSSSNSTKMIFENQVKLYDINKIVVTGSGVEEFNYTAYVAGVYQAGGTFNLYGKIDQPDDTNKYFAYYQKSGTINITQNLVASKIVGNIYLTSAFTLNTDYITKSYFVVNYFNLYPVKYLKFWNKYHVSVKYSYIGWGLFVGGTHREKYSLIKEIIVNDKKLDTSNYFRSSTKERSYVDWAWKKRSYDAVSDVSIKNWYNNLGAGENWT